MLQSLRDLAQSWIVKSLMLLLMISFSIWGIGDIFRGNALQKAVASVGDVDITVQQLNQLFERSLAEVRQRISPDLTAQQARQMGLLDKVLQQQITQQLIDMDIQRQGISVRPEAVLNMLASDPQLQTKDGKFNKPLFRQLLEQQRMSEGAFLAQGQLGLSRQILMNTFESAAMSPQLAVDALFKARAQKRILDVVVVDSSKMTKDIPTPDDQALRAFYDANQKLFAVPEYRAVTIGVLSVASIAKDVSISDEQIKKEYEAKREQLKRPELRDVVQVVLQDEAKAKQLTQQARVSSDLVMAAKNAHENAVPLDGMEPKNLMPDLSKAIFSLHEGAISEPIKTQLGWHVVQLKKIHPDGTPSFEQIRAKLKDEMIHEQAIEMATSSVNQIEDQLAAGHSLDDIADGFKLRLVKISAMDAKGMRPDGKEPPELPNKEQVLRDAFAQSVGDTTPATDDKSGDYYIVRTDDVTPAGTKSFDEAKDQVAQAWRAHQQMEKAQAKADKIVKALSDGAEVSSFNGDEGVSSRESEPLSLMGDMDKQFPSSLLPQASRLKKGEAVRGEVGDKQYVLRLSRVMEVDTSKPDPRKNMISREIKQASGEELVEQYIQHLRTVFPVKTNASLLDSLRQKED